MSALVPDAAIAARLRVVDEHIGMENRHDLEGIMQTFGADASYDDEPWNAHYHGRDEVRGFYADMLRALPDLTIDVQRRHVAAEAIILEVVIAGHHLGDWRGLMATGRPVAFPLCGIFTFDQNDRLAGEKIYYDRAMVLRQLGVFHEPDTPPGRVAIAVTHPLTMLQIAARKLLRRE
ncbi:MAG: hypothetical protein C5B56_02775 [Proteobacteria bacterium]|nr:MAG: hypothetical protein C5B56_02775 [Pseudomonadota bacterium]